MNPFVADPEWGWWITLYFFLGGIAAGAYFVATLIEMFGQDQFDHLTLNTPYRVLSAQDAKMPGFGTFHNRDVQLTWVGRSERNGQACAVIDYRARYGATRA